MQDRQNPRYIEANTIINLSLIYLSWDEEDYIYWKVLRSNVDGNVGDIVVNAIETILLTRMDYGT
jgi:hypothetical protein